MLWDVLMIYERNYSISWSAVVFLSLPDSGLAFWHSKCRDQGQNKAALNNILHVWVGYLNIQLALSRLLWMSPLLNLRMARSGAKKHSCRV